MRAAVFALMISALPTAIKAEPSKADIAEEITRQLSIDSSFGRQRIEIENIDYKTFYDERTGTGRVSAGGKWTLQADLYRFGSADYSELVREMGINERLLHQIADLSGMIIPEEKMAFVEQTYAAGSAITYRAELNFVEHFDGFTFTTDLLTRSPRGEEVAPDDPKVMGQAKLGDLLELIRSKYQPIEEAGAEPDPSVVYLARLGSYTMTAPPTGVLLRRASQECIVALGADGQAVKVEAATPGSASWEIVRVGAGATAQELSLEVKASC